jgi:hypothetical protein
MPTGLSAFAANGMLNGFRASAFSVAAVYIKLHTGDPGSAFTANAATETTRKLASFAAASGGSITSNSALTWTAIAGSQTATHFVAYDDLTAGNALFSGVISPSVAYNAGDTVTCASGSLSANVTLAS